MSKKSYIRGSKILIFFTVVLFLFNIASLGTVIDGYRDLKTLYSEEKYQLSGGGYAVIRITGIEKTDIQDESLKSSENFYLVNHERGFVMLKASAEQVENMIGSLLNDEKTKKSLRMRRIMQG